MQLWKQHRGGRTCAAHADEDAGVDGGPGGARGGAPARAVGAGAVLRALQQALERGQLLLVVLHAHALHLARAPAKMYTHVTPWTQDLASHRGDVTVYSAHLSCAPTAASRAFTSQVPGPGHAVVHKSDILKRIQCSVLKHPCVNVCIPMMMGRAQCCAIALGCKIAFYRWRAP